MTMNVTCPCNRYTHIDIVDIDVSEDRVKCSQHRPTLSETAAVMRHRIDCCEEKQENSPAYVNASLGQ